MADRRHLKLHHRKWSLNYRLPTDIARKMGRTHVYRSLGTGDLAEAQRRRNELLGELEREFRELRGQPDWQTPSGIVAMGRVLAAKVAAGETSREDALEDLDTEAFHEAQGHDPENLTLPPGFAPAFTRAREIVRGEDSDGLRLSDALDRHLEALSRTARASTVSQRKRRVMALCDALGDPPLVAIDRRDLARHVLALTGAVKTRKDTASDLTAFFRWAVDAGLIGSSPAERLSRLVRESSRGVADDSARRPWTDGEVADLLGHVEGLRPGDYLRKLVPIALYSGMRLNEICAIQGKDIENACFVIREGKTKSSLRKVPIHSKIAHLVEGLKPSEYLIPGLEPRGADNKRGHEASKRFGRYKSRWGFGKALVFHGLRASFIAKLENAGVPVSTCELIVGHRRQSMSYGTYSKGIEIDQLRRAVEKVEYKQ